MVLKLVSLVGRKVVLVGSGLIRFMFFVCRCCSSGMIRFSFLWFRWLFLLVCGFRLSIVMCGVGRLNLWCSVVCIVCRVCFRLGVVIVLVILCSGRWVVVSVMWIM